MKDKIIYGAGYFGIALKRAIESQVGERVIGFIDRDPNKSCCDGLPVYRQHEVDKINVTVYVSIPEQTMLTSKGIVESLDADGFNDVINFNQALKTYPEMPQFLSKFSLLWMSSNSEEMIDNDALVWLKNTFTDELSKDVLEQIVAFRKSLHASDYPSPDAQIEYFPNNVPWMPKKPLRFVDGGAYIGDTLEMLHTLCRSTSLDVTHILAFEPDRFNWKKLVKQASDLGDLFAISLFPCALWSETSPIKLMHHVVSSSSGFSADEGDFVQAVALDEIVYEGINYIKLDVEGSELQALKGMKGILENCCPNLAVCVYHKPSDLWEIPRWLYELNLDYQFYLRQHGPMGIGCVLYAIHPSQSEC